MVRPPSHGKEYSEETRYASPAHLLMKIKSFSMLSKHKIVEIESMVFEAGGHKWKVRINLDEDYYISANLCMVGASSLPAGWEVNAIFTFFLYNGMRYKYRTYRGNKPWGFCAENSECVFSDLITMDTFKEPDHGFLIKDKCVFGAEVFVVERQQALVEEVSVHRLSNPYQHEWKISKFSTIKGAWMSEEFSAVGYKWVVKMYPNGTASTRGRYVSVYLFCVDANSFGDDKKVNAACRFCFRNNLNVNEGRLSTVRGWFTSTAPTRGFNKFIAIDDMCDPNKGFVVDDCCILEIRLSVHDVRSTVDDII